MSKYLVEESTLTDIADAIREQTGDSNPIPLSSFANEIQSIVGGGSNVELTQVEYDALTTEEKNNGSVYFITDASNEPYTVYSTTEKQVGVWIDGSAIYERVVIFQSGINLTKGAWTSVSAVTMTTEDTFISTRALLPSHKSWMSFAGKNDSGTFKVFSETAFTIQGVIIQYTKASA